MSTLKTVTILHPSSAVNNIVNDASGNVAVGNNLTVAGDITSSSTVVMGSSFKRNRIINGNMLIDQRNAGASVTQTTTVLYTVDRWAVYGTVASKFTIQQNAGSVTPPAGFTNYLGITSSSAYSVTASDVFWLSQYVEGYNVADLGWGAAGAQSVTLSFWVRSSLTGTFGGALRNSANTRSYPFSYTISAANTWEQKTITVAGDTTGTWLTTNGTGVNLLFGLGVGSTTSGTAGAWAATNYVSATGAVSVVGTNGATFYVTGVQLEVGTKATPYEMQIYSDQLAQCQRYYETGAIYAYVSISGLYETTAYYKQTMRASPTVNLTVLASSNVTSGPAPDQGNSPTNIFGYYFTLSAAGYCHSSFTASAEL
tara:strand:+ start:6761 stop:7867 length:1107 start_codon:yes stop_codon:yes gene_type:complete